MSDLLSLRLWACFLGLVVATAVWFSPEGNLLAILGSDVKCENPYNNHGTRRKDPFDNVL